jgi:1,4-alpha-glucan branching enzyme
VPHKSAPPSTVLVLHAHLPWVIDTEEERWLHEAMLDCYLPLLDVLEGLKGGSRPRLTLSVTPVLAAMWRHPRARQRTRAHLQAAAKLPKGPSHRAARAWHRRAAEAALESFERGDLVDRLATLWREGRVELITSGVTHGFLPLLMTVPQAAAAQIALGVRGHQRWFGRAPAGFWLPECAYAPGLELPLAQAGVRYTFVDSHAVEATVEGTAAGVYLPSGVAAFARDPTASEQVWSAEQGYPADPAYADFHHRLDGQRLYRVTGAPHKEPWEPQAALARAGEHAAHFLSQRRAGAALQVAPYDAELFGHWWLEGPAFLKGVLEGGADVLTTAPEVLRERPTLELRQLPFSSWGRGGDAQVWLGEHNAWMWPHLHRAALELAARCREKGAGAALQALLLAQASDWPFLIDAGTSAGFAQEQFERHLLDFRALLGGERRKTHIPFPWADASVYMPAGGGKAQPAKGSRTARAGASAPRAQRVGEDRRRARARRGRA